MVEIGDFIITTAKDTYEAILCVSSLVSTVSSGGALAPLSVLSCSWTVLVVARNAVQGAYGLVDFAVCPVPSSPEFRLL